MRERVTHVELLDFHITLATLRLDFCKLGINICIFLLQRGQFFLLDSTNFPIICSFNHNFIECRPDGFNRVGLLEIPVRAIVLPRLSQSTSEESIVLVLLRQHKIRAQHVSYSWNRVKQLLGFRPSIRDISPLDVGAVGQQANDLFILDPMADTLE